MNWKYYKKPFDIKEPPIPPPLVTKGVFGETRSSKRESEEWRMRIEDYGQRLRAS